MTSATDGHMLQNLMHAIDRKGGEGTWYERMALHAYDKSHYRIIHGRTTDDVYLIRFWASPPRLTYTGNERDFESGNSLLLHYFPRPDDDDALHNHPWDFDVDILFGGYVEYLPWAGWTGALGPAYGRHSTTHLPGTHISHKATDLHSVARLLDTHAWTMVRTGPRVRDWGFHPEGKPEMPWREYIAQRVAKSPTPQEIT